MRFRLDSQHYHEDKLLEPGTEVGDDCDIAWRYAKDVHQTDEHGNEVLIKAGTAMPPSAQMTPLDEEAKRMVRDWFKTDKPVRNPMDKIPLQGTGDSVKVQAPGVPRPGSTPSAQHKVEMDRAHPQPNPGPTREPSPASTTPNNLAPKGTPTAKAPAETGTRTSTNQGAHE